MSKKFVILTVIYHTIPSLPVAFRSPVRGSNLIIRALSKARAALTIKSLLFLSNVGSVCKDTYVMVDIIIITGWFLMG
jgi:hypothetical protein